jgi:hypothetical protein
MAHDDQLARLIAWWTKAMVPAKKRRSAMKN